MMRSMNFAFPSSEISCSSTQFFAMQMSSQRLSRSLSRFPIVNLTLSNYLQESTSESPISCNGTV